MKKDVSCIVAFYNETDRILGVLEVLSKINEFNSLICVDDGSTDSRYKDIKKLFPKITLIRFQKNKGKSAAIEKALEKVKDPLVFLIDGDLKNLQAQEIKQAISIMHNNKDIDMILLTRMHTNIQGTWQRANCIFSGERILRTIDLHNVFKMKPKPSRYQIEIALNHYMITTRKKVFWIRSSAINFFKRIKFGGFIKGEIKDLAMHFEMMQYVGFFQYLYQVLFFSKHEYKETN